MSKHLLKLEKSLAKFSVATSPPPLISNLSGQRLLLILYKVGLAQPILHRRRFPVFSYKILSSIPQRPSYISLHHMNLLQFRSSVHSHHTRSRPSDLYFPARRMVVLSKIIPYLDPCPSGIPFLLPSVIQKPFLIFNYQLSTHPPPPKKKKRKLLFLFFPISISAVLLNFY